MSTFYLLTSHINDKLSQYENHNIPKKHIKWAEILVHVISIPSIYNMTTQEKNILWYSHDNIRQFGQSEIKRRAAIGIKSNSILYPQ